MDYAGSGFFPDPVVFQKNLFIGCFPNFIFQTGQCCGKIYHLREKSKFEDSMTSVIKLRSMVKPFPGVFSNHPVHLTSGMFSGGCIFFAKAWCL